MPVRFLQPLRFHTRPDTVDESNFKRFYILSLVGIFGFIVHALLIPSFMLLEANFMAQVNLVSLPLWFIGLLLNHQGKHAAAVYLFTFEVILHSVCAAAVLGLNSGFQFYLWSISALIIIHVKLKPALSFSYNCIIVTLFGCLYFWFEGVEYTYAYPELLPVIHFLNIIIANLPLAAGLTMTLQLTVKQELALRKLANKDDLTNLYNRRYTQSALKQQIALANREQSHLCIALGDIDYFKKVNDKLGHDQGDLVLIKVAKLLQSSMRRSDIVSRWGGEEFLIVMPSTQINAAFDKIEKLRVNINQAVFLNQTAKEDPISMSFGLVEYNSELGLENTLKLADNALYKSKDLGRNQTTIAQIPGSAMLHSSTQKSDVSTQSEQTSTS